MRDRVRLVDGPLAGREFTTDRTPTIPLDFGAAVAPDGEVLAVEGEPPPLDRKYHPRQFRYKPVMASDGYQSRDDDGSLPYYFEGARA